MLTWNRRTYNPSASSNRWAKSYWRWQLQNSDFPRERMIEYSKLQDRLQISTLQPPFVQNILARRFSIEVWIGICGNREWCPLLCLKIQRQYLSTLAPAQLLRRFSEISIFIIFQYFIKILRGIGGDSLLHTVRTSHLEHFGNILNWGVFIILNLEQICHHHYLHPQGSLTHETCLPCSSSNPVCLLARNRTDPAAHEPPGLLNRQH